MRYWLMKVKGMLPMKGEILAVYNDIFLVFYGEKYYFYNKEDIATSKKNFLSVLFGRVSRKFFFSHVWVNKTELCINFDRKIIIVNFLTYEIHNVDIPFPMKALNLFLSRENEIFFSPYATNRNLKSIGVFKLNVEQRSVVKVANFSKGVINHVHSFYQLSNGKIFANVGDQSGTMGAWEVDVISGSVRPSLLEDKLRTVVCEPLENNKWITITDIPSGFNYLHIYTEKPFEGECELKLAIGGPVIYGQKLKNYFYYAISGEPRISTFLNRWIINVEKRDCSLYRLNLKNYQIERVINAQKDRLPYALFGFGNFKFIPSNCNKALWLNITGISMSSVRGAEGIRTDLKGKMYVAKTYL